MDFYWFCVFRYLFKNKIEEFKIFFIKYNVVVLINMKIFVIKVRGKFEVINCFR